MSAGSHKSVVTIEGKLQGLTKQVKTLNARNAKLEESFARLSAKAAGTSDRFQKFDAATAKAAKGARSFQGATTSLASKLSDVTIVARGVIDTMGRVAGVVSEVAAEGLKASAVYENMPFSVEKAQVATAGLVTELELAQQAVVAERLQVVDSADDFAVFTEAAAKLGRSVGITAAEGIDSLTVALGRASTRRLDDLGILLKQGEANEVYAKSLGKTVQKLTDAERAESFRKVGLQRVIEAAEDITVTTDGAAAAVARFNVELQDIKTNALAGDAGVRTIRQGSERLALTMRISSEDIRKGGAEYLDFKDALADVGVETKGMFVAQNQLADALKRSRVQIRSKIKDGLLEGEVTAEQVDQMRALLEVDLELSDTDREIFAARVAAADAAKTAVTEETEAREEELRIAQDSLAFLQGKGEDQELINALLQEEARLRIEILEAEGKSEEASKARRSAELAAQKAQGVALRARGGGRRKDIEVDLGVLFGNTERKLKRIEAQEARALRALDRTGAGAQKRFDDLTGSVDRGRAAMAELVARLQEIEDEALDPFSDEALDAVRVRAREIEQARSEVQLEERLRSIEKEQTLEGSLAKRKDLEVDPLADPIKRAELEADARLQLLDIQREQTFDSIELAEIENQREQVLHDLSIARITQKTDARREGLIQWQMFADEAASAHLGIAEVALSAALMEEGSLRRKVAEAAKAKAFEFGVIEGPSQLVFAAIAAGTGRPVKAAAHLAAAGKAFAFGATMAGIAGASGAFKGTVDIPGADKAITAGAFGDEPLGAGGGAGGGPLGGSHAGAPSGGQSQSDIPPSPTPQPGMFNVPAAQTQGPPAVNFNFNGPVMGTLPKHVIGQIDIALRDLGHRNRRASA